MFFTLEEVTAILIRNQGLHTGLFDLSIELNIGVGGFGPTPDETYPGATVGVKAIGLQPAKVRTPRTLDAAEVNPKGDRKVRVPERGKPR